jgi:hypothetical protein
MPTTQIINKYLNEAEKVKSVVSSCKTETQLRNALNYFELFKIKRGSFLDAIEEFDEIEKILSNKFKEFMN